LTDLNLLGKKMGFNVVYTDTFPADLTADHDIAAHDETVSSGKLGLVKKDGVVCRTVRLSTSNPSFRTHINPYCTAQLIFIGRLCASVHRHNA